MINVYNITKRYGAIEALRGVSFSIEPGEIVGLLGPNGAGKSTAIKIITGFLHPDDGWVEIDGKGVLSDLRAAQARIGYLSENTPLYPELSVQGYLMMIADLRGASPAQSLALLSEAIYGTGLQDYLTRPISSLSKGLRQRVGLAQAILHKPSFLILDEPTVGLDPTQIVEIRALIKGLARESSILFSSHILSDVEAICDRVIIIINGQVKADQNLRQLRMSNDATLVLQSDAEGIQATLGNIEGVTRVSAIRSADDFPAYRISSNLEVTPAIYALARAKDWPVREIRRDDTTLEAFFNQLATTA
ncbi:MAG: ABC transporter ATP-binding protein [Chloroflexota bacterium]|nr:ABC transporter ATP-binding protein [Chloroflexota bacterium]MDE2858138.1 ABC transporter ATP-binding protein [Chloroflexota bacterium]MDE2950596.1 ABC transporter ATP-binding protein [Chloroflexota bacterium]